MSKPIRLSHSAVSMHSQCGYKYKLHYIDRLRPIKQGSALVFGSAMDLALNELIISKDLAKAEAIFDKNMHFAKINDEIVHVPESRNIKYSKADLDTEILTPDDLKLNKDPNWLSLRRKGLILLKAYQEQVLPKIKEVICLQKEINLQNEDGDTVIGFLDLAVIWEDGKRYILDNKTASRRYDENAVEQSQQLSLYFHAEQEEMKLDGAGFIVMLKEINKNRKKICAVCGFDGSGTRYKTCNNEILHKHPALVDDAVEGRCDGEWIHSINPTGDIQILLGKVSPQMEDTVINTFDEACTGIKSGVFEKNLNSCFNPYPCAFRKWCLNGDGSELLQLPEREEK
jgi:hypothetical protein